MKIGFQLQWPTQMRQPQSSPSFVLLGVVGLPFRKIPTYYTIYLAILGEGEGNPPLRSDSRSRGCALIPFQPPPEQGLKQILRHRVVLGPELSPIYAGAKHFGHRTGVMATLLSKHWPCHDYHWLPARPWHHHITQKPWASIAIIANRG